MIVNLTVNTRPCTWEVQPDTSLADALRAHGLLSIKKGCDQGVCGNCTVWIDKVPMLSCSVLCARMEGRSITTVEGVSGEAEKLGFFLAEEGSDQCGFCAPGFIMQVLALKKECSAPVSEQELSHLLAGNLCRCSGYRGKMRAAIAYLNS